MSNASEQIRAGIIDTANALGMDPRVLATIISYETGGTFDPTKRGPTTQWGQHRGLIQFGEPQARQHGVDWNDPINSQLGPNGAVARYFRASGWQPGMSELDAYSIVNAGGPGRGNRTDANNGGAPGTVADKVNNQFAGHRTNADRLLSDAGFPVRTSAPRAGPDGQPMVSSREQRDLRLADVDPMNTVNNTDMEVVGSTPARTFRSRADDRRADRAASESRVGFGEATWMAIDEGQIAFTAARQMGRAGFEYDPDFQISEEQWASSGMADLPRDYQLSTDSAINSDHFDVLAAQTLRAFEVDQQLGQRGIGGIGLRLGAAMLDPVAIGLSAVTAGAAGPLLFGAKLSRAQRFLRGGAAAAALNVGIDGYLIANSPLQQWEGIAYSAAAGFALGGAFSALGRTQMDADLQRVMGQAAHGNQPAAGPAPVGGSQQSIGAVRVPGTEDIPRPTNSQIIGERFKDSPYTAFGAIRFDMTGRLKASHNPVIRQIGALLGADNVGNKGHRPSIVSADENVGREMRTRTARFYTTFDDTFNEWAKAHGLTKGWGHKTNPAVRQRFNEDLGKAMRRDLDPDGDPAIQRMATRLKAEYEDLLKYGREKNIPGFAEIKANQNYLNRRHRVERLDALVEKHGEGRVHRMVATSMISANNKRLNAARQSGKQVRDLDYEDALNIAKAYVKSIRARRYGQFEVNQAFNGDDMDALKTMLREAGVDDLRVQSIADSMNARMNPEDAGRLSVAKFRLDLDETTRDITPTERKNGSQGVGIEDFLENDAEFLFTQYARSVIGAGEIEDAFSAFKVPDANGMMPAHAPSWQTVKKMAAENHRPEMGDFAAMNRVMDTLYRAVRGLPQEEYTRLTEALRMTRDYNFSRVGNQMGLAQIPELGNVIGQGGMRAILQNVPELRHIFSRARNGKFSDDALDEIEAITGMGTDTVRFSPRIRNDETAGSLEARDNGSSTKMERLDHGLQQMKFATTIGSGMAHINMGLQRWAGRVLTQRFMNDAMGRRGINHKRLAALGIDKGMHGRIQSQMQKHVKEIDGSMGQRVKSINMDAWDDIDARNAFANALTRWQRRVIQENDMGGMPAFTTKAVWKSVFQFRSFMLQAYTKMLLNGVHHADWETASSFMTAMFFASLVYVGQTHLNSIGRADRDEHLQDRLSPSNIGLAAFQRAGFASIIPMGVDAVTGLVGAGPMFDFRTTDLSNQLIGNPTYDLIQSAQRSIQSIIAPIVNPDYEFSQQDYRALTKVFAYQNAFGIRNLIAAVGGNFPRFSQ